MGDKCSYVDLAFLPWQNGAQTMLADAGYDDKVFPHVSAWLKNMNEREKVKKLVAESLRQRNERMQATAEAEREGRS